MGVTVLRNTATMIVPLLHLLAMSFSSPIAADSKKVFLLPVDATAASWAHILRNESLWQSFGITVYITIIGTLVSMLFSVLTAYPLARKEFLLRKPIMLGIVITMIFNAPMIPFLLTVRELGLMNSLWALIIPGAIGTFNMIIIRSFFMGIPGELDDSARIDGCNDFVRDDSWKETYGNADGPRVLCELRCSFHSQKVHAHPRFTRDGSKLLFTSDKNGYANLYIVEIPDAFEMLPSL